LAQFEIITFINNTPEIVFDLSRSIDLHLISLAKTREEAVGGVRTGLIGLNETVTWRARHLFKTRLFTSAITAFHFPFSFTDEMIRGDLKSFSHQHIFVEQNNGTLMTDKINLEAPFGLLGRLVMVVFLKNYFRKFLIERSLVIKKYAESGDYASILKNIG